MRTFRSVAVLLVLGLAVTQCGEENSDLVGPDPTGVTAPDPTALAGAQQIGFNPAGTVGAHVVAR